MQTITVNKQELLDRLHENRDKHRQVFEVALEEYRKEALSRLEYRVEALKTGKFPDLYIGLQAPSDHTRDYDRVIKMVEMHQDATFQLTEADFSSYVMDDWDWKRQWVTTTSHYAAAAVAEAYGENAADDA